MRKTAASFLPGVLPILLVACVAEPGADGEAPDRVSEFGRYEGYSEPRYDGWVTTSRYVEMRDGVRLAVEVTRPALGGVLESKPLPVVWTHSRYHRNPGQIIRVIAPDLDPAPDIRSQVDANEDLQRLVLHGYVVAAAGVRGSGASFGRYEGLFSESETTDAVELIEWLASQPWSDGNVGMYGGSYLGITQYMAASRNPPALKAIFPDVAALDMYDLMYPGGVYRDDLIGHWGGLTREFDVSIPAPAVDEDVEGVLLRQAMEEHEDNWDVLEQYGAGRYRDHAAPELAWERHGPSGVLEDVLEAGIPAYHWNGWYDIFVTDATLWFANYRGPQKLGIGAWSHSGMPDPGLMAERIELYAVEQHRWFDYWLKGIENGVLDEAPIHYAVMNDPGDWRWVSADAWPPETTSQRLFLAPGTSGSVASVNDGGLSPDAPTVETAFDEYLVDLSTTTGTSSRWDNAVGAAPEMVYPDLRDTDAKSLTYTTPPLESDLTVTGHPVVTLWVTSSKRDADFFVLLEEVDAEGSSRYVTEGVLRASHRALAEAPWENLGLPFQRSYASDVEPLPEEPAQLRLDLHPTSTVFNAGHRLRVTVMGADRDNAEEVSEDPPTVRVYRSATHPSSVELPVAPGSC
ncbi:MAG: CocE/NonD family hydrolase [Gemmatimonadales bacterium]|nr:CocE/NonD family hydrolase [Gemmatimonadales bacterium]MYL05254.1 CocE/NonD family hydrolase [Gemmatimonadales bacterium]